jgi:hypothetical protein
VGADVVEIAADHGVFGEQPARLADLQVAASASQRPRGSCGRIGRVVGHYVAGDQLLTS